MRQFIALLMLSTLLLASCTQTKKNCTTCPKLDRKEYLKKQKKAR